MPTYKLTDPDTGRTVRVTGSSPPNEQEIESIFSSLSVQEVPAESAEEIKAKLLGELAGDQSALDAFLISAGRGLTNVGRGLGIVDPEDADTSQSFKALEEARPISTTVGEIVGEAAPFLLPGGAVAKLGTIPARIAGATALGGAEAGIISSGKGADEENIAKSVGLGGVIGGTLEATIPIIGRIGGKIFRKVTGRNPTSPLINRSGQPTQEFTEALDKAGLSIDDVNVEASRLLETGDVDDAVSLARKQFLEEQGLTPTRAQVTGDATEFQVQQELAKKSGKVRRALEGQEGILASRFENAITATGGSANASSSSTTDFIADRSIDLDMKISQAYNAAREAAPIAKVVSPDSLIKEIRKIASSDRSTGGLVSAARDILRDKGVIGKGFKKPGKINAEAAEEIRKDLNALHNSLTPHGKSKLADFKSALDNDVGEAIGIDIFKDARASKAKFEKDLNRARVNKFDKRNKNLVRDILENKVNPDRFFNDAVLSKSIRSDDLEQLKRFVNLDGTPEGAKVWNDVRAEAMEFISKKALKEVAGEPALSRAGIESALDGLGRDKLRVLFSKEERKFLNDMLKTSKIREPKRGTALGKGPSAQAIEGLTRLAGKLPLMGEILDFLKTSAANRAAVRDAALKKVPLKPSQLTRLTPAITTTATEEKPKLDFTISGGVKP